MAMVAMALIQKGNYMMESMSKDSQIESVRNG